MEWVMPLSLCNTRHLVEDEKDKKNPGNAVVFYSLNEIR